MKKITLYPHQVDMYNAMKNNDKGIIHCPTGGGKSLAEAAATKDEIDKGNTITVVSSPRIGLSNQLSAEFERYFASENINPSFYNFLLIHSGNSVELIDEDMSFEEIKEMSERPVTIEATTFVERIYDLIDFTFSKSSSLVIFTTYHSTQKVFDAIVRKTGKEPDLHLKDEAQYLTREDFHSIAKEAKAKRSFSLTATPIVSSSDSGRGMNNKELFGDTIYSMSPETAIRLGLIVKPLPLLIRSRLSNLTQQDIDSEIGELVYEGFRNTRIQFEHLGAKMLVATKGAQQIRNFINSEEFNTLIDEGVHILTVHSNKELLTYNGNLISRKEFEKLKKQLGRNVSIELILVHFDILSEGIDIPGLLSVLILRELQLAKFFQTIGRVLRVFRKDPLLKLFGLVMFPDIISSDSDIVTTYTKMITSLGTEGYLTFQELNDIMIKGLPEEDLIDLLEESNTFSVSSELDLQLYSSSLDTMNVSF